MSEAELREFLTERAEDGLLPWSAQADAARRFATDLRHVELAALEEGLLPTRYRRNRETLSVREQLELFRSRVAVIGCGGLGGYLVEELSRLGIGSLVLVDPDVFEEHNLNRQILSSPGELGRPKVEVGRRRAAELNPAVSVIAHRTAFSRENGAQLLSGASAVLDGLDSASARRDLAAVCREMSLPLVHGAIAGWYGQIATQLPGEDISSILETGSAQDEATGRALGNPSFTPAAVASLQVAELVKVLLRRGTPLARKLLLLNLLDMRFEKIGYR